MLKQLQVLVYILNDRKEPVFKETIKPQYCANIMSIIFDPQNPIFIYWRWEVIDGEDVAPCGEKDILCGWDCGSCDLYWGHLKSHIEDFIKQNEKIIPNIIEIFQKLLKVHISK